MHLCAQTVTQLSEGKSPFLANIYAFKTAKFIRFPLADEENYIYNPVPFIYTYISAQKIYSLNNSEKFFPWETSPIHWKLSSLSTLPAQVSTCTTKIWVSMKSAYLVSTNIKPYTHQILQSHFCLKQLGSFLLYQLHRCKRKEEALKSLKTKKKLIRITKITNK